MKRIGELFARDPSRSIPSIVRIDDSEDTVLSEVSEYVFTDRIKHAYGTLLYVIADALSQPHGAPFALISGPLGVGRTAFVRHLGYALANPMIQGTCFVEAFLKQANDLQIDALLKMIHERHLFEVVCLDVARELSTSHVGERISELMYRVLCRKVGYSEDFDIAELEIALETEGKLEDFARKCQERYGREWTFIKKGAMRLNRASAILHELDPEKYPFPDTWAQSQHIHGEDTSLDSMVERIFDFADRRCPGKVLVFILDEIDSFIARGGDRILDLRATLEAFLPRRQRRCARVLCWVFLVSQNEAEYGLDANRMEWSRLQDKFQYRICLTYSDMKEIVRGRLLAKNNDAVTLLKRIFSEHRKELTGPPQIDGTSAKELINEEEFIDFYPFPPRYIDLCIRIVQGIELSNRTSNRYILFYGSVLSILRETLLREVDKPLGSLVTLANVYEVVSDRLPATQRHGLWNIERELGDDPDAPWCRSVTQVICLLEFGSGIPSTSTNIAAFLVDEAGKQPPLSEVQAALCKLRLAGFVWDDTGQWKLQPFAANNQCQ